MKYNPIISLVAPPFPTFIEGNITQYNRGQVHPNRSNLPYFDIIFVLEGQLSITENNTEWVVKKDEMLILLPDCHHFSTEPCQEKTKFFWLHFFYDGTWAENEDSLSLHSTIPIPDLHYHNEDYTIHINKWQKISDSEYIYTLLNDLLKGTRETTRSIAFWDNQHRFSLILKSLEEQSYSKTASIELAEKIELYISNHYHLPITNKSLSDEFHYHENYLIRCMKKSHQMTPLEYLATYRLEKAASLLIKTNWSISTIALKIGFRSSPYFSLCFKKKFNCSPLAYRQSHSGSKRR